MRRRLAIAVGVVLLVAACGPATEADRPTEPPALATFSSLQARLDDGSLTSEMLVRACLDRIAAYDRDGPALNAMIAVDEGALATARALDLERRERGPRGPLHGIPVVLKDNYDAADLPTTGGSALLRGSVPADDAHVVRRLREAGAVILGKANMSEFALSYGWLGYGSRIGQTRNPHGPLRDPSGSSSGSAVAVAAGFTVLGTGTDTAGSVRGPAAVCGIVGIKPTMGLVSRDGIIPCSLSFDVAGPLARSVEGAAVLLDAMQGADDADPATRAEGRRPFDLAAALAPDQLAGARLGVVRTFGGADPGVDAVFAAALAALRGRGAEPVEVALPAPLDDLWPVMGPVVDGDFGPEIEAYLDALPPGGPRTLADLIAAAESPEIAGSETPPNPARLQGFREALASGGHASDERGRSRDERIPAVRRQLRDLLDGERLDALVFPTLPCVASPRHDAEDPSYVCDSGDPYRPCYVASTTGWPEITVPAGFTARDGMPVGLSFLGRPFSETRLVGLALDFEQATRARRVPAATPPLGEGGS